jgi:hypothetical protein
MKLLRSGLLSFLSGVMLATAMPAWSQNPGFSCRQFLEGSLAATSIKEPKLKRSFRLFKEARFRKKYVEIVEKLQRGDEVVLPSGARYLIHSVLGQGDTTKIFDIGDGLALRLPIHGTSKKGDFDTRKAFASVQGFYELQRELSADGVHVIEMDERRSEPPFALIVKKETFQFTAAEFFDPRSKIRAKLSPMDILLTEDRFIQFMISTWHFTNIGDVFTRQIGYNGREWVLFDFNQFEGFGHSPLRSFSQKDIIMSTRTLELDQGEALIEQLPPQIEIRATEQINAFRAKMAAHGSWFERSPEMTTTALELIDRVMPDPLPANFHAVFHTQSTSFQRDFESNESLEPTMALTHFQKLQGLSEFSIYRALENDHKPVLIYILKKASADSWKHLESLADEAKRNHRPYLLGDDFILFH